MNIRERINRLAKAAKGHCRFVVYQFEGSTHIKFDGWDVATMDENNVGYNNHQLTEAEKIFNISEQ